MPRPHHDTEEHRHREHRRFLSEQKQFKTVTDLTVLKEMALDREDQERRDEKSEEAKPPNP